MTFTLHFRLFIYLVLGFIITTVVGTITHELGHIAVAKILGYKTQLHYASMNTLESQREKEFEQFYEDNKKKILSPSPLYPEEKATFTKFMKEERFRSIQIIMGGPIQTILTGTLGFLLLWFNRKKICSKLKLLQWTFVFLAFFWSRQIANFFIGLYFFAIRGKWTSQDDETHISEYFEMPVWSLSVITAIIGIVILLIVVFKLIPKQQRFTFIVAGLSGSIIGFSLWMKVIGPVILP